MPLSTLTKPNFTTQDAATYKATIDAMMADLADATPGLDGLQTETLTTSGTSHPYTGIPSWVTEIDIMLTGVSTAATGGLSLQIGDAGGLEASGYNGSLSLIDGTNSTILSAPGASFGLSFYTSDARANSGNLSLVRQNDTFTWTLSGIIRTADEMIFVTGSKTLSAALTQLALNTGNSFDAGSYNIRWS